MAVPYQESYGDDRPATPGYWEGIEEDLTVWRYGDKHGNTWYDWIDHIWKCRCPEYRSTGACKHAYRYRRQVTIEVNEEYL